jgi:hypothetical protein
MKKCIEMKNSFFDWVEYIGREQGHIHPYLLVVLRDTINELDEGGNITAHFQRGSARHQALVQGEEMGFLEDLKLYPPEEGWDFSGYECTVTDKGMEEIEAQEALFALEGLCQDT